MCGIFGAVDLNGFFNDKEFDVFSGLTDMVSYRGPDGSGYIGLDSINGGNNNSRFNIFLGHRRLSIIDLSDHATQPMKSGNCHIVFNGEIFNYLELRKENLKHGFEYHTSSDTEVILNSYRHRGMNCIDGMNGMWAFLLADLESKKLIVSRDRFSIKPLYYHQQGSRYYFASEIKQLIPLLKNKSINQNLLFSFMQQALLDHTEETFIDGIRKVKAATSLVFDLENQTVSEVEYWNYPDKIIRSEKDSAAEFKELLEDSIRIRLRSDVPVGSLLSGGLDSSSITVIGNQLQPGGLDSFSVISKERKYSEEQHIDSLIRHNRIHNSKMVFQPVSVADKINEVMYHQDEPFGSLSILAQYLIFEKIKKETPIIVVLSGQGGDEALMGYNKYFFFNILQELEKGNIMGVMSQLFGSLWNRTALTDIHFGHALRYMPFYSKKTKSYLTGNKTYTAIGLEGDILSRQISDFKRFSVPSLAHYEDRNSMAFGLEVRHPFLDHRLVSFMLSIQPGLKMKNGWSKYILRKSMTDLPDSIRWRRDKKGFVTPDEIWMKSELKPLILSSMKNSLLADMGLLNSDLYLKTYEEYCKPGSSIYYNDLFRVFISEIWARNLMN